MVIVIPFLEPPIDGRLCVWVTDYALILVIIEFCYATHERDDRDYR